MNFFRRVTAALRDVSGALVDALKVGWVWAGMGASLLLVLGTITPAYLPQNSPWWPPARALKLDSRPVKIIGTLLMLVGVSLLTQSWLAIRTLVYTKVRHWAVLGWWSLPLLFAPPIFSHDAYSYAAQGWLVRNGINPYQNGPGVLPGAFADQSPWVWRFTPTPYGPLSLEIQHGIVNLLGADPYWSAVAMRLPALLGVVLIVLLVPRIATWMGIDPAFAAWFATLNPILITDFVGGAHNDALMTGIVVLALWLATLDWWLLGAFVVGVAAAIKQPAFLAAWALPFIGYSLDWRRWQSVLQALARAFISCAVAIGAFVLISLMTGFDFGWKNAIGVPGSVITVSPFTTLGLILGAIATQSTDLSLFKPYLRYSRLAGMIVTVAAIGYLSLRMSHKKPIKALSWSFLAAAFGGPALHGWYVLWGGVLLPLAEPSERVIKIATWISVGLLSYAAINMAWRNGAIALGIAFVAPLAWQVSHHFHSTKAQVSA